MLVHLSVSHDFLKGREVHFHAPIGALVPMCSNNICLEKGLTTFWEYMFYSQKIKYFFIAHSEIVVLDIRMQQGVSYVYVYTLCTTK